jgi:hypothetical protein
LKKDPVFYDRNKDITQNSLIKRIESKKFSYKDIENIDFEGKKV